MFKRYFIVAIAFAACMVQVKPAHAESAPTLAELDAQYDRLVSAEDSALSRIARLEAGLANPDETIFARDQDGILVIVPRSEFGDYIDRVTNEIAADILDIDRLNAVSPEERALTLAIFDADALRDLILRYALDNSPKVQASAIETLRVARADLEDIRDRAEKLQAERVALRAAIARGDGSDLVGDGGPTAAICLNESIPVDGWVLPWTLGFGGDATWAYKGNIICQGHDAYNHLFLLVGDEELTRYYCALATPEICQIDPDRSHPFEEKTDDEGRRYLEILGGSNRSTITYLDAD